MYKPIYKHLYKKMLEYGVDPSKKGFMYIHEAVLSAEVNETMGSINKKVSAAFGCSEQQVERSIRVATPPGYKPAAFVKQLYIEAVLDNSGEEKVGEADSDQLERKISTEEANSVVTPLTRAEIRRLERESKSNNAKVQLSYGQLKAYKAELKKEITEKVSNEIFLLMLGMPVLAMKDMFEVNIDTLDKFTDRILIHYQSYCEGRVTIEEIWKILEEETGKTLSYYRDKT